jgi:hypothetical protein
MIPARRRFEFQFSLRTFLLVVALLAIACVGLKNAGSVWWAVLSTVSLLVFLATVVIALVGQERERGAAIGYVACATIYGALWFLGQTNLAEMQPVTLPTSTLLDSLHQSIATQQWVDAMTGKVVPNYAPALPSSRDSSGSMGMPGMGPPEMGSGMSASMGETMMPGAGGGGFSPVVSRLTPDSAFFMAIGHLLMADLLGVLGAVFAVWVQHRSHSRQASEATPSNRP